MSEISTINHELPTNLSLVDTETLRKELARGLEITARHLHHLARIWRELESRGEDLSDIRHGLFAYLPQIADGKVVPEIVINYAGKKTLLATLACMPVEIQRRISETSHIEIVTESGDVVETPVNSLRATDISKIFDITSGTIRDINEQRAMIGKVSSRKPRKPVTSIVGFEQQDGSELLVISGKRVKISRVLSAIAEKYPAEAHELSIIANKFN